MNGNRFYKVVIAVLLLINISTIGFIWFNKPPHPPRPGEHQLSTMLGLTGENKQKVDVLEDAHHKEKRMLVDKDMKLHKEMYKLIGNDGDSEHILNQIQENKQEIEEMTFNFFDNVAAYCDKDQKARLREFVHTAFEQMHPPRR